MKSEISAIYRKGLFDVLVILKSNFRGSFQTEEAPNVARKVQSLNFCNIGNI